MTGRRVRREFLCFAVLGASYSGHGAVRTALDAHPEIVCHGDLLHMEPAIRRTEHAYSLFDKDRDILDFEPAYISAEQYLNRVYEKAEKNEKAVGVKLSYDKINKYDLWQYLDSRVREGDFCAVHVLRNPVSCYVRTRREEQDRSKDRYRLHALYIEPEEMMYAVRLHLATCRKIEQICSYRVVVQYAELRARPRLVADYVCPYMGLRESGSCYVWQRKLGPSVARLVANWAQLLRSVDDETRKYMEQAECETNGCAGSHR